MISLVVTKGGPGEEASNGSVTRPAAVTAWLYAVDATAEQAYF